MINIDTIKNIGNFFKEWGAKIGDVVGQKGKTINEIIARTGVKIDITDDADEVMALCVVLVIDAVMDQSSGVTVSVSLNH